ncbi:hypothetical protein [Herbiconiux liukaitaii]|uniref:hypothetical protein n=1 Tax=Herbiconiux liukaitaii TaxID=3342799 RepID=UPI0035BB3D16
MTDYTPLDPILPAPELIELQSAIGAVAMASARLEETLSRILAYLAGSDEAWILFTGRAARSAIDQSQAIIAERTGWVEKRADLEAVTDLLKQSAQLLEYRNGVVHALWSLEASSDEAPKLPWHRSGTEERILYPARSRMNKGPTDQAVTISDVQELAGHIDKMSVELIAAVRAAKYHLAGGFAELPSDVRWYL